MCFQIALSYEHGTVPLSEMAA